MKYLRRGLWFISSRLLMFSFCTALVVLAFTMAMNMSNIFILLSDGMEARADVILTRSGAADLTDYFRDEFLSEDAALKVALSESSPWLDYRVTGYAYELQVNSIWCWPWEDSATASITETVGSISGSVAPESQQLVNEGLLSANPPPWQGGEYQVTLYRAGGKWRIAGLKQTRVIIAPTPVPAQETPTPAPLQDPAL